MSANDDTLARLTFNAAAMREYVGDDAKGVRLKIERGVVTLRPAKSVRGVDVIAIERRPRGTLADIGRGMLPRRLMQGLFKAGLTEDQPYFVLGPAGRGWVGIEHVSDQQAPRQQPLMVVSDFDPPPTPIDMAEWQRFLRLVAAGRSIPDEVWKPVWQMMRSAEQIAARKGRRSQVRESAERLLAGIERNAPKLLAWSERQPEVAAELTALLTRLGVELEGEAEEPPEMAQEPPEEPPEVAPDPPAVTETRPRRTRRKSRSFAEPEAVPVESMPWIVTEDAVVIVTTEPMPEPEPVPVEAQEGEDLGEGSDIADEATEEANPFGEDDDPPVGEPDAPEETPQARREREAFDQTILDSWEAHETLEPNISTERLIIMVEEDTGASGPRQIEAMQRAGWPLPSLPKED